jgi:hypothetical protein
MGDECGVLPVVSLVGLGLFERGFPVVKALVALLLFIHLYLELITLKNATPENIMLPYHF